MHSLTTNTLLASRQCQKRLWLSAHEPAPFAMNRNIEQGLRLGEIARKFYGPGIMVSLDAGMEGAVEHTREALAQRRPIFEATFVEEGVTTRLDILRPTDEGRWDVVEVKSSGETKDEHLKYLAVQAYVCQQAGLDIDCLILAHINTDFVYPGDGNYDGLLVEDDVTEAVKALIPEVPTWIAEAQSTLSSSKPAIDPGRFCNSP